MWLRKTLLPAYSAGQETPSATPTLAGAGSHQQNKIVTGRIKSAEILHCICAFDDLQSNSQLHCKMIYGRLAWAALMVHCVPTRPIDQRAPRVPSIHAERAGRACGTCRARAHQSAFLAEAHTCCLQPQSRGLHRKLWDFWHARVCHDTRRTLPAGRTSSASQGCYFECSILLGFCL